MSSSNPRSLATGGSESFCIWDTSTSYEKSYSHCPSSAVVAQSWSNDGSCLASLPRDSNTILMTYSVKNMLRTSELSLGGPVRAMSFPRSSSMKSIWVSYGSNISQVKIKTPETPYKDFPLTGLSSSESVSCLALNVRDDHAVLGTNRGRLKLVNLLSGYESSLSSPDEMNVNDVKYNNVRHALLGLASDSGAVSFWDVHARKKLSTFKKHASPASGITFSPVNEMLVLSAGLDKKCICYDTKEKKPVSTINTDYSLTCVDFQHDGFILALGTSRGRVLIYDLRSYDSPIHDFEAHGTFVHSIKYAIYSDNNRGSAVKLPLKDVVTKNKVELSPILQTKDDSFKNDDSLGSAQVFFSPLRRDYTSSPLDLSSNEHGLHTSNTTIPSIAEKGNSFSSPLSLIKEEIPLSPERTPMSKSNSRTDILSKTKNIKAIVAKTASMIKHDLKPYSSPKFSKEENKENENDLTTLAEEPDIRHVLTAFPSCLSISDPLDRIEEAVASLQASDHNYPSTLQLPSQSGAFQQAYIGNIVKESMQDFSRELRSLIWAARYDSIKMFYELNDKIEDTILEASPSAELIEENRKLKQEIETLKSFY
ncbi:NEDD1 [Lepeophtheirus salmonis]|uniref:NEDD1 n=1 Tax=Lepeophtheirus salmonis TaxID=72036 RepID=A0A7R8D6E6_LEPSM|nr:NEDD1 [Lepeophtheirus salmonis]CAF3043205.1 NEDD1 [Lepeophtheirus salmonis]